MQEQHKARIAILSVSGAILCASAASWVVHAKYGQEDTTPTDSFARQYTPNHKQRQAAEPVVASLAAANVVPVTSAAEAASAARAEAGRSDPTAPIAARAVAHAGSARPFNQRTADARPYAVVPPPPAYQPGLNASGNATPALDDLRSMTAWEAYKRYFASLPHRQRGERVAVNPAEPQSVPAVPTLPVAAAPERTTLSVDDVRLVGIVDNKAIFTLARGTARRLNLPRSVTLAPGQQLDAVRVESVSTDSATVRDGEKVAIKELADIR